MPSMRLDGMSALVTGGSGGLGRLAARGGRSLLFNGQALNISVVSYAGQFNLGFTGCRDSLPSMQRLAVYTGEALEELEAALA